MMAYILLLAVWDGGEWSVMESNWRFRKQETCQVVATQLMKKQPKIKHYRCIERTSV